MPPAPLTLRRPAADGEQVERDTGYVLAPLSRRAAAWLIDAILGLLLAASFVKAVGGEQDLSAVGHLFAFKSVQGQTGHDLSAAMNPATANLALLKPLAGLLGILTVVAVAAVAYRVVTTALWGAGFGKIVLGMRVVVEPGSQPGGDVPGWARSWKRWAVPQAAGLIPLPATGLVAYLPALRDSRRRGLHDRAAGTVVIDLRAPTQPARHPKLSAVIDQSGETDSRGLELRDTSSV